MDDLKSTFKSFIELVKFVGRRENGKKLRNEDVAQAMGITREYLSTLLGDGKVSPEHIEKIKAAFPNIPFNNEEQLTNLTNSKIYTRTPKIETNPDREGVIFVPIAAQANYVTHYTEPLFIENLERIYIPGFPYRGDKYRIFEVAGDSMEPTFKEGYYVVTEYLEPTYWHSSVSNYYVYVVVTMNQVMLKRVYKKSEKEYVMISDNEEFHPQFVLPVEEIKEMWYVRRKIDWEMPPPKKFDITV